MLPPPHDSQRQPKLPVGADIPLVPLLYQTYYNWHGIILKFPKPQRYTLGQECSSLLLSLLRDVLAAAARSDKRAKQPFLQHASADLDVLRLLIRLAKDCDCLTNDQYLALQSQLYKAGKMIGGWLKSVS